MQRRKDFKRELVEVESFLREFLVTHELGFPVEMNIREAFSIRGNGEQLSRVLENLLDNSAKYADAIKGVSISCYIEGKDGVIDFSDSGNGVSQDVIGRIFNPFFKGDESRRQDIQNGSGLGLAICRTIVEAMDGSIHAAASESGGLLIQMRFPREEEGVAGR